MQTYLNTQFLTDNISRFFVSADGYKERAVNSFLHIFSPKQISRPDSMVTCCKQMFPYLQQSFAEQTWKISFLAKSYLFSAHDSSLENSTLALTTINRLETAIMNNQTTELSMNSQEAESVREFLNSLRENDGYKLDAFLKFSGNESLWRTLKACRELFQPLENNCVENLQRKMESIQQSAVEPMEAPFRDEDRLTAKDLRLLIVASARQQLLEILNKEEIDLPSAQELEEAWTTLRKMNECELMQKIRERSKNGYKPGRVFFYDWNFIQIKDFYQFDVHFALKHILYSRIPHLGIVVTDNQNQPNFSHVNGGMGTHGIHPIRFPLMGALGNFGELNITPLIPSTIPEELHQNLQQCFTDAFIKFASEEHEEVKLERRPTCWLGHTSSEPHNLSEVELSADQPQFCSSYVGLIFLKAVREVNNELSRLGYKEQIAHPFGEYEIIDRVDTLRLIYHWKQLKVLNVVPLDTFVNKVFATPTL